MKFRWGIRLDKYYFLSKKLCLKRALKHRDFVQGEDIGLKACRKFLLLKVTYLFFYIKIKFIPSKLSSCKRYKGRRGRNDSKNLFV